jgi:hypothetical protein
VIVSFGCLTLTLFMTRIGANDAHHAFAANDAAVFANATNRAANFHDVGSSLLFSCVKKSAYLTISARKKQALFLNIF